MASNNMIDPVQVYKTLADFANDEWGRCRQKDKSKFCFDLKSKGAKLVQTALNELVSHRPFAVGDCIEVDYFKNWFQQKSIDEWKKLFGDSVDEDLLKAALMMKRIPIDGLVNIATPALFGKGTETVYDTNVRRAWDITADRLRNGDNNLFIFDMPVDSKISKQIEDAMKPKEATWTYKLYKMHLYGPGDKFLSHVDTLHASNHVATVVVGLPLQHTGGSLVVKHMDSTVNFNLSNDCVDVAKYCAFFTDCDHEVEEVTSGWRIVLQYDVYQENASDAVNPMEMNKEEDVKIEAKDVDHDEDMNGNANEHANESGGEDDNDDREDDEDNETEEERSKLDELLDKWLDGRGSTSKLNKIAIAAPNKNLEDAVIRFFRNKNLNDRLAILFHHYYSLPALQDCILKGTDSVVYDAFVSEKWTRKLQGIVIKAKQEDTYDDDDSTCTWESLEITPISLEDFGMADVKGQEECACSGTTYLLCYGVNPPRGTLLAHTSEYAGNHERNEFTSYFMTCIVLEYNSSTARTSEVTKKMKFDK
jgi:2OG-Fe(II) oxygenase superfamily